MDKPIYNVEGMRLELLNIKLSIRRAWLERNLRNLENFYGTDLEAKIKGLAAKIDNLTEEEMLNEIEASQ